MSTKYSFILPIQTGVISKVKEIAAQNKKVTRHFFGYLGKNYVIWAEEDISETLKEKNIPFSKHQFGSGQ